MPYGPLSLRINRLPSVWPKRMSNVGSLVLPLVETVIALNLIWDRGHVPQILAKSLSLIVIEFDEELAVCAEDAVVDGYHDGADHTS